MRYCSSFRVTRQRYWEEWKTACVCVCVCVCVCLLHLISILCMCVFVIRACTSHVSYMYVYTEVTYTQGRNVTQPTSQKRRSLNCLISNCVSAGKFKSTLAGGWKSWRGHSDDRKISFSLPSCSICPYPENGSWYNCLFVLTPVNSCIRESAAAHISRNMSM